MRIEAFNQIQQLYNTSKTNKSQKTEKPAFADQVQISSIGKDIQTAKQAVANAPDVREEITAPIKSAIAGGTYQVSMDSFADKIISANENISGMILG